MEQASTFYLYTGIIYIAIAFSGLGILLGYQNKVLSKLKKNYFMLAFLMNMLGAFFEWSGTALLHYNIDIKSLFMLVKSLEFICATMMGFYIGSILYSTKMKYVHLGLEGIFIICLIFNYFFEYIFKYDNGVYEHGNFYFIYFFVLIESLVYIIVNAVYLIKKYKSHRLFILFVDIALLLSGIILQAILSYVKVSYIVSTVCEIIIFIFYGNLIEQIDPLSLLQNRRNYESKLALQKREAYFVTFDINSFKQYNDIFGHQFGDKAISTIGLAMQKHLSKHGNIYRIGGDEFFLIAEKKLDQLGKSIEALNLELDTSDIHFRDEHVLAVGVAHFDPQFSIISDVIKESDESMYKNKKVCKNNY